MIYIYLQIRLAIDVTQSSHFYSDTAATTQHQKTKYSPHSSPALPAHFPQCTEQRKPVETANKFISTLILVIINHKQCVKFKTCTIFFPLPQMPWHKIFFPIN